MGNPQSINSKQQVIILKEKSKITAVILALFFGPFGVFYSSAITAIIMLIVVPIIGLIIIFLSAKFFDPAVLTLLSGLLIFVLVFYNVICAIVAYIVINKNNKKQLLFVTNSINNVEANKENFETLNKTEGESTSLLDLISYGLLILFVICLFIAFYEKILK